jgi:hypothetical protein
MSFSFVLKLNVSLLAVRDPGEDLVARCVLEPRVSQNGPVHMSIHRAPLPARIGSHKVAPAARGRLSFRRGPADHREMIGEIALVGTRPITGLSSSCSRSSTVRTDAFTGSVEIQHESASCTADRT